MLERAQNAREAIQILEVLLLQFEQGGNGHFYDKLYYHSSFMIADPKEAWIVETGFFYFSNSKICDPHYLIFLTGSWKRVGS